jgi:hypothetical protein
MDPLLARKTWRTAEPLHGFIYFAPEADERYRAAGLEPGQMGYFASRGAVLGAVPAEVVIATFFNFWPGLVRPVIPKAWSLASIDAILAARLDAADAALRRGLGDDACASPEMVELAGLLRRAAEAACERPEGRPLFAAHTAQPWPEEPHLVVWWAETLLREFRGDAHIAALVGEGVTAPEALVIHAATGDVPAVALKITRAWPAEDWADAERSLADRGWLDPAGDSPVLTADGIDHRQRVEDLTDVGALPAYEVLGQDGCERVRALARPFSRAVVDAGLLSPDLARFRPA